MTHPFSHPVQRRRAVSGSASSSAASPLLQIRGLQVHAAENRLVHGVDLEVRQGERVGLIGESGCGKSLTALSVLGLLPDGLRATGSVRIRPEDTRVAGAPVAPGDGAVELLGMPERHLARLRGSSMAMVFQEPMRALNPTMRAGDQVAEAMLIYGTRSDRRSARRAAVEVLADVRLPDPAAAARAYPHQLSGGQQQRVVLAMALANDPALLICDEPTTALDVTVQANVLDLIVRGIRARGSGLLFITHDLAVVATVCERVAVMLDGRIVESGATERVFTRPEHPYTRHLLAASDLRDVDARGRLRAPTRAPIRSSGRLPGHRAPSGPSPDGSAVELLAVSRRYRRPRTSLTGPADPVDALRAVSLTIRRGERVGIVGESGCGKSTLLRLVAGLDRATAGTVRVDGVDITRLPDRRLGFLRQQLQLVFQDPMGSLDPRMRVGDSVAEPLRGWSAAERSERVRRLLTAVGLQPQSAGRYPHQFSGGQRQRISLARALAPDPQILLADEPVSALDVSVRAQVLNLIADLVDDLGLTLVFVSHDLSVVRHVCQRVVVMKAGQIIEDGPTERVYRDPQQPYTRRLVASVPTLARALHGTTAADLAAARRQEHPDDA